jgi:nucleotide-binding universal stress UspA family protein
VDEKDERPVVVGVTGVGQNTAALRFAADLARQEAREVLIVHAAHQPLRPPPPSVLLTYEPLEDIGNRVVRAVEGEFAKISGGTVPCSSVCRPGPPVEALVDASTRARVVVLQHRDLSRLARVVVGSTVSGVAAHARCPVVSVPEFWATDTPSGRVTVGVHEEGAPEEVLDAAFAAAASRGGVVHVIHAWRFDNAYEAMMSPAAVGAWREHEIHRIAEAVGQLRERYPQVVVEPEVRHQQPAEALVEQSAVSDLVVLGRHGRRRPLPERLGSIARTLVREARCPVMVVPVDG